jgi:hypothetical protein
MRRNSRARPSQEPVLLPEIKVDEKASHNAATEWRQWQRIK